MRRSGSAFHPHTYEDAVKYLKGARDRNSGRPLQNNTRLVLATAYDHVTHAPIDCVGVQLHRTIVVAYLPNGNIVLNSGGWHTVTTQDRISNWSPARVGSDFRYSLDGTHSTYKSWVVTTSILGHTPAKVQKCRRCKGVGSTNWEQWGRSTFDEETGKHGYERYDEPVVQVLKCWSCDGNGRRDYGSKRVCPSFEDGVVVNGDGEVIAYGPPPTIRYIPQPPRRDPRFRGGGTPTGRRTVSNYWVAPTVDSSAVYRSPRLDAFTDEFAVAPNEDGVDHGTAARFDPDFDFDAHAKKIEDEIHAWAKITGKEVPEAEYAPVLQYARRSEPHTVVPEDSIAFGELVLNDAGNAVTTNVRIISRSTIANCPQYILLPEHYREDGTCRCDEGHYNEEGEWVPNE